MKPVHSNPMEKYIKYIDSGQEYKFYKSYTWQKVRNEVVERDHYECKLCKSRGGFSKAETVHHIKHLKDRPDLGLDKENLISLCNKCHTEMHDKAIEVKKKYTNPERW